MTMSPPTQQRRSTELTLSRQLTRRKPLRQMMRESGTEHTGLLRSFGLLQLTMISVGATLGTGIFVVLGDAVPIAGPAVWISFVVAGVAAMLSALSYAEMAGAVPVSGSSYSYTYATMGEGLAWICGWCLLLEYAVSVAAIAVGAGEYLTEIADTFGVALPAAFIQPPGDGGLFNVPAVAVVLLATVLLIRGSRESALVNTVLVALKVAVLLLFVAVAFTAFDSRNFAPLLPMGSAGVTAAASRLFFSYIGFDAASTAGDEARNPQRDLPRAIVLSMVIITALYILVALAAVGARPWGWFDGQEAALVRILEEITGSPWVSLVFALGAVVAIVSIVLVVLYGQTRILMAMSRDGLVPPVFARVSPRTGTPVANTLITGGVIAAAAGLVPLGELADATSIGTLFAFGLVSVAVIHLRRTRPELPRTFRVPLYPVTPVLAVLMCVLLMVNLGSSTWVVFVLWMAVGSAVYLGYGRRHSTVAALTDEEYARASAEALPAPGTSETSVTPEILETTK
ncbi:MULTISPECIES: amino acid permease [Kocuria]|jgi:APA family basic amino acid/polyamine antiporter|uniref:amino acid permease n=1 Tax=Kocuria TaxID=57493 RepID=UPI00204247FA|nr:MULTISPECIES: amino acid permease [Kocuria]MCM3687621.1 amino acid permease [Kocuria rosea]HST71277.1 amino acid permease [Kocuria rosea]